MKSLHQYRRQMALFSRIYAEILQRMSCSISPDVMEKLQNQAQRIQNVPENPLPLVKICGCMDLIAVQHAIEEGARLIGIIFAKKSPRFVSKAMAKQIVNFVDEYNHKLIHQFVLQENINFDLHDSSSPLPIVGVIGVFVDDLQVQEVNALANEVGLHGIQLHGAKHDGVFADNIQLPVIQVIPIDISRGNADNQDEEIRNTTRMTDILTEIQRKASKNVIAYLFDTKHPQKGCGGAGIPFDWNIITQLTKTVHVTDQMISIKPDIPILVAGGLTPENVRHCIAQCDPFGIDISSGVEKERESWSLLAPNESINKDLKKISCLFANIKK